MNKRDLFRIVLAFITMGLAVFFGTKFYVLDELTKLNVEQQKEFVNDQIFFSQKLLLAIIPFILILIIGILFFDLKAFKSKIKK